MRCGQESRSRCASTKWLGLTVAGDQRVPEHQQTPASDPGIFSSRIEFFHPEDVGADGASLQGVDQPPVRGHHPAPGREQPGRRRPRRTSTSGNPAPDPAPAGPVGDRARVPRQLCQTFGGRAGVVRRNLPALVTLPQNVAGLDEEQARHSQPGAGPKPAGSIRPGFLELPLEGDARVDHERRQ
jgi:hypothetical protein